MTRPDLDAILPPVSTEDESTVDALLAKAREGVGKRPIGRRPDLDAIRARCEAATSGPWKVEGLEIRAYPTPGRCGMVIYDEGGHEESDAQFIAASRTDIPALLAYIDELEAEAATLRHRDALLKRVDDVLAEAGCVQPLSFDGTIESAIEDLARRATRAEQLFVDEYDARRDVERERDELQARIAVLEAMKP